jgi:hypothetical protein
MKRIVAEHSLVKQPTVETACHNRTAYGKHFARSIASTTSIEFCVLFPSILIKTTACTAAVAHHQSLTTTHPPSCNITYNVGNVICTDE